MNQHLTDPAPVVLVGCRQPAAFRNAQLWALHQGCVSLLVAPVDWPHAAQLAARFAAREVLTDDVAAFADCALPVRDARSLTPPAGDVLAGRQGPVAILLTSGSTGEPKPVIKDTRAIRGECELLLTLWPSLPAMRHVISTVACEHMFGYTFGFWLPRHLGATLHAQRPLTPADLRQACASAPAAPWIICTPTHLRACVQAQEPFAAVAGLICATSSLSSELATAAVRRFQAPLLEIYGSTEAGAMAWRLRAAREAQPPLWIPLPGVRLSPDADGVGHCEMAHIDGVIELGDLIAVHPEGFELLGRQGDLVKVCGKRQSLAALNQRLLAIAGVRDGVYHVPPGDGSGAPERAVAFVVLEPGHGPEDVLRGLRGCIDDVFLPRPVVAVEALPRTEAGKLRAADLARMYHAIERNGSLHRGKDS